MASLSVTRQRETSLRLFAVARQDFTDLEAERFTSRILPKLRRWLVTQRNKPETAVLGVEECVVEQTDRGCRMHTLRYL